MDFGNFSLILFITLTFEPTYDINGFNVFVDLYVEMVAEELSWREVLKDLKDSNDFNVLDGFTFFVFELLIYTNYVK